jgi:NAD(P)-dependent dehydrogenase (short-subunit alcohol dehydrogenase family)
MDLSRSFSIAGKVALVTGASHGIGAFIAEGLVAAGVKVYAVARKADALDALAQRLSVYGSITTVSADLGTAEGVASVRATLEAREPALDILVNNAGIVWVAPLEEFPRIGFERVFALNVVAMFDLTRSLLPLLRRGATPDDPARVVNVTSVGGEHVGGTFYGEIENFSYGTSKAAANMLTRKLARHLLKDHILVNAVAPGTFRTRMNAPVRSDPAAQAAALANIPMRREGRPGEIAGPVIFLCSPAANYITGAIIPVSGGMATLD